MASASTRPIFPSGHESKVVYLSNLPCKFTDEQLLELGKPFGKVVNTQSRVGGKIYNSALIEFESIREANFMISSQALLSRSAQIPGKTLKLQFTRQQEIMGKQAFGRVLVVTITGDDAHLVGVNALYSLFSKLGTVDKITVSKETAGQQAFVQFLDSKTASFAKNRMDGRKIYSCLMETQGRVINSIYIFSSHRSYCGTPKQSKLGFTKNNLPVAPSAADGSGQIKLEPLTDVLLVSLREKYSFIIEFLNVIFSSYGTVLRIAKFDENGPKALVQYSNIPTAVAAKKALGDRIISLYEGEGLISISYSSQTHLSIKVKYDQSEVYTPLF